MNRISDIRIIASFLIMFAFSTAMAQDKKFTLDDLNYGGNNYHNMTPKNRYATWWGDILVRTDAEECMTVDKKNGKETMLFSIDDINKWAATDDKTKIRSLFGAKFP